MLQSLVASFAAYVKAFSQPFFLPRGSPIQLYSVGTDLLSLCLSPCAPFSLELPFSPHQGETCLNVHLNFLYFPSLFEPYFLFLFYLSSLSLSGTQSFRQHLICWVLSGRCGPPPPDSFGCGCLHLILCFCCILWALLNATKTCVGRGQ